MKKKWKLTLGIVFVLLLSVGFRQAFRYWRFQSKIPTTVITRRLDFAPRNQSTFLLAGDTGFGTEHQKNVAELMNMLCEAHHPMGVLYLGDNFYMDGVKSVDDPLWKSHFEDIYHHSCLQNITFYPVLGNHDYRNVPDAQIQYTHNHRRWFLPARFYEIRVPQLVHILAMDSNYLDTCGKEDCQMDWAQARLKDPSMEAPWRIIMAHHPVLSGGPRLLSQKSKDEGLFPIFCNFNIDFYFSGHEHNFQHLLQKKSDRNCPVNQFVLGNGGAPITASSTVENITVKQASVYGASLLTLTKNEARFESYTLSKEGVPERIHTHVQTKP